MDVDAIWALLCGIFDHNWLGNLMKEWQLRHEGNAFLPKKYLGLLNEPGQFTKAQLQEIKAEAFGSPCDRLLGGDYLLGKILSAGMCTGLSAWTLLNFVGQRPSGEERWAGAVLQARVLLPGFWRPCLADYSRPLSLVVERLRRGWASGDYRQYGLLFIAPKITNFSQINHAHTLLPYKIGQKSNHVQIAVYDCNDPYSDQGLVNMDLLSGDWQYKEFDSTSWYLSVQGISCLLQK